MQTHRRSVRSDTCASNRVCRRSWLADRRPRRLRTALDTVLGHLNGALSTRIACNSALLNSVADYRTPHRTASSPLRPIVPVVNSALCAVSTTRRARPYHQEDKVPIRPTGQCVPQSDRPGSFTGSSSPGFCARRPAWLFRVGRREKYIHTTNALNEKSSTLNHKAGRASHNDAIASVIRGSAVVCPSSSYLEQSRRIGGSALPIRMSATTSIPTIKKPATMRPSLSRRTLIASPSPDRGPRQ